MSSSAEPISDPQPPPTGQPSQQQEQDAILPENANATLYINNLNEKVKLPVLKQSLEALFSTYGKVLNVTAHANLRMRGQAFVSFNDVSVADQARKEVGGFPLYGKPMKIDFARNPSDAVVLDRNGDDEKAQEFQKHKKLRLERKKISRKENPIRRKAIEKKIREKKLAAGELKEGEELDQLGAATSGAGAKREDDRLPDEYLPPNKILFLQNIPDGVGKGELEAMFSVYPNYQEVQTIPGKSSIAFVEFSDIPSSASAREALNGYNFGGGDKLKITFARA
ncbi:RNA-binding domain-containing protein [Violaceomyces palustris]|uniref:RNA-binding domain-containing protein n=1 Tax=Violaceomyces palustris TaxID=1673888 RepID=A0ACD0P1L3_9BASI|nr:RNA-binding domain-containing protein [Violaceomyces palustris]